MGVAKPGWSGRGQANGGYSLQPAANLRLRALAAAENGWSSPQARHPYRKISKKCSTETILNKKPPFLKFPGKAATHLFGGKCGSNPYQGHHPLRNGVPTLGVSPGGFIFPGCPGLLPPCRCRQGSLYSVRSGSSVLSCVLKGPHAIHMVFVAKPIGRLSMPDLPHHWGWTVRQFPGDSDGVVPSSPSHHPRTE